MRVLAIAATALALVLGGAAWRLVDRARDREPAPVAPATPAPPPLSSDPPSSEDAPEPRAEPPGVAPGPAVDTRSIDAPTDAHDQALPPDEGPDVWPSPVARAVLAYSDLVGTFRQEGAGYGGAELSLTAGGFFTWRHWSCVGESTSSGVAAMPARELVLAARRGDDTGREHAFAPVRWGPTVVLVSGGDDGMAQFLNVLHGRWAPRFSAERMFLVSNRGFVLGVPELPAPWAGLLRRRPLVGTVIRALPAPSPATPPDATYGALPPPGNRWLLDRGSDHGVFVGMWLRGPRPKPPSGAEVVAVRPTECEIESPAHLPLAVGESLHSGVFTPR